MKKLRLVVLSILLIFQTVSNPIASVSNDASNLVQNELGNANDNKTTVETENVESSNSEQTNLEEQAAETKIEADVEDKSQEEKTVEQKVEKNAKTLSVSLMNMDTTYPDINRNDSKVQL